MDENILTKSDIIVIHKTIKRKLVDNRLTKEESQQLSIIASKLSLMVKLKKGEEDESKSK